MIHLEIDQLNRITVIKQIYAALDPSHKNLMENVKRILDSNQPEEVRFRIVTLELAWEKYQRRTMASFLLPEPLNQCGKKPSCCIED